MSVSFHWGKFHLIRTGIFFAFALFMFTAAHYPVPYLFLCPAAYFLIDGLTLRFTGKWKTISWVLTALYFAAGPVFSTLSIQHIILEPELFRKTKQRILRLNMLCVLCIYLLCLVIIAEARYAWRLAHLFCLFIAFLEYYVYEFRENEVTFADLSSAGTGLSVMKSYRLKLHDRGAIALLLMVVAFVLVRKIRLDLNRISRWILRAAALAALIGVVIFLKGKTSRMVTQTWEKKGSYKNGFVLNFVLGIGDGIIHEPEGYSEEMIRSLEERYDKPDETVSSETETGDRKQETAAADGSAASGKKPVIITIMNESFADFRNVGDLKTNKEVMPFFDSLQENVMRGFALSSVYGAKTPNSEWEYMTGNTMAFLPEGSVVYEQFLSQTPTSMVTTLKNAGYATVAMHPYQNTGWRRNTVYPRMGFDEMYFLEDGYFDETNILRKYITDQELYDRIIDRYEQQQTENPDQPLFIMSITMQNHGGYREKYDNFTEEIVCQSGSGNYEDANQFLSLEYVSDQALENLIGYFSQQDVPVEIIFFGDHLPSLQTGFFRALNGKGISGLTLTQLEQLFAVPFVIWTNYDTREITGMLTSLNFLGTFALQRAGIGLPAYNQFLAELMEHVPAMNARAFYSMTQKKFLHYDKAEGEEKQWIDWYKALQYNEMFDKKNRSEWFFPYLDEAAE